MHLDNDSPTDKYSTPPGRTLLSNGQDTQSIDDYVSRNTSIPSSFPIYYDPREFVKVCHHFYHRVREQGINIIGLVWQSATYWGATFTERSIEAWYPGGKYVDWMGLSYFVQVKNCPADTFDEMLDFAQEPDKPATLQFHKRGELTIIIDDGDLEPRSAEDIWQEWYAPFFLYIHANPGMIRAHACINAQLDTQPLRNKPYPNGYWGDSSVQVNELIKQRWIEEIRGDFWSPARPNLFGCLGYAI